MARPREIIRRDRDSEGEESAEPTAGGSDPAPAPAPPSRRGDTAERIRVAAADAADAAEQRSIEEILALEEDLERAKVEAATKLEELEGRLTGMEQRAANAEREAQEADEKAAELERELAEAREGAEQQEQVEPPAPVVDEAEVDRRGAPRR